MTEAAGYRNFPPFILNNFDQIQQAHLATWEMMYGVHPGDGRGNYVYDWVTALVTNMEVCSAAAESVDRKTTMVPLVRGLCVSYWYLHLGFLCCGWLMQGPLWKKLVGVF
jgi:hypothetical protein